MVGRPRRGDAGPAWAGGTPVGEERANGMPSGGERSDGLRAGGTWSEGMTSGGERADGERAAEAARGLVVSGARVTFAGQESPALDDVDVTVDAGRVLAVLGPSGCGKSTLLRAVAGLQRLDAGRVSFDGDDVTRVPTHKRDFALMFQDGQLFGHLDVAANVAYGLARRGVGRAEQAARVGQLLDLVGLPGYEKRSPATLSGGQQQRVALARALAVRPRLLLLDEPLSALDRGLRERLSTDLRAILTAENATALFVTHDHGEALTVADDIAVMRDGRIVQHGAAREVWAAPSDEDTADFLGFTTTLDPDEAAAVGLAPGRWKLRQSALRVVATGTASGSSSGDGVAMRDAGATHGSSWGEAAGARDARAPRALAASIVHSAVADEVTRVSVRLDALPTLELAAVAYPGDVEPAALEPGARAGVVLDASQGVQFTH